ncbi:MAG: hypothetical protein R3197_17480 [Paracoccaceae bacterium]|nr:hypothetical protein [Paracoccaceae bacterium]
MSSFPFEKELGPNFRIEKYREAMAPAVDTGPAGHTEKIHEMRRAADLSGPFCGFFSFFKIQGGIFPQNTICYSESLLSFSALALRVSDVDRLSPATIQKHVFRPPAHCCPNS